ncbi:SDR family oxidoreductase [Planobispora siamensis]|uniref:Short chain dehydrogenase n=1 Tax=Planobispora siamensis TaxID=936338 RepID=A0A8J3SQ86_9ACTN|nr:SDR family oxidoreductase [Planobispora siamensis]GIH97500.1 hypothetical protein Psi01_81300 [Planobispora siamensis]
MNPTYDFTGQVAFVTGAGPGMGLATARAFARAGAAVALTDINETALAVATKELTGAGYRVLALACDVSDESQVAAAIDRTVTTFGRPDMAFNNAGVQIPPSDAAEEALEEITQAVLWLCSPGASFVIGVALPVDGGYVAR